MEIFEFYSPGSWVNQYGDEEDNHKIRSKLEHLRRIFYEANTALNLFIKYHENRSTITREQWFEKRNIDSNFRAINSDKYANLPREEQEFVISIEVKKAQWKAGYTPTIFESTEPFIYAKSFLFALDNFVKVLESFEKLEQPAPEGIKELIIDFRTKLPTLNDLRNSLHHVEDRIERKARKKLIVPAAVNNSLISAPEGSTMALANLRGSKIGATAADGDYKELEISRDTLLIVQDVLQSLINLYEWKGIKQHYPT